jgi:hypothetical protein
LAECREARLCRSRRGEEQRRPRRGHSSHQFVRALAATSLLDSGGEGGYQPLSLVVLNPALAPARGQSTGARRHTSAKTARDRAKGRSRSQRGFRPARRTGRSARPGARRRKPRRLGILATGSEPSRKRATVPRCWSPTTATPFSIRSVTRASPGSRTTPVSRMSRSATSPATQACRLERATSTRSSHRTRPKSSTGRLGTHLYPLGSPSRSE